MNENMRVRVATGDDIQGIAGVYKKCFPSECLHFEWIQASFNAYPRNIYYVAEIDKEDGSTELVGYILWCCKNGFRKKVIVELEQIGVVTEHSGKGWGRQLIEQSKALFEEHIKAMGLHIGALFVTTREGNYAEKLYCSSMSVEPAAVIENYGSGNELILYKKI